MFKDILITKSSRLAQNDVYDQVIRIINKPRSFSNQKITEIDGEKLSPEDIRGRDMIIAIGGDGTMLRTSSYIVNENLVAINADMKESEGALCNLNEKNIEGLEQILRGEYSTLKRTRAVVHINGKRLRELALNEAYIGKMNEFDTAHYIINFEGISEEHRSSGGIVATGSGSSGWYHSAQGERFKHDAEELRFLVREPVKGRVFRPTILQGVIGKYEKISFISTRDYGGVIALDGYKVYDFNNKDIATVELSEKYLHVLIPK